MTEHDDLSSAFAEYRTAARQGFSAEPTESVFQAARRRKTHRITVGVVAAAVAVAGVITASSLLGPTSAQRQDPAATPTMTPGVATPSASPTPAPSATGSPSSGPNQPGTRTDPANQVRFLSEADRSRLRRATITLPVWPEDLPACAAGQFTFVNGVVSTGASDTIGRPYSYHMLFRASLGIYANLDGSPGDEMVVPIACGFTEVHYQLLVVKQKGDELSVLAYLPGTPSQDRFYPAGGGLIVEVHDSGLGTSVEQRRGYRWNGERFVQTSGPTTFPPTPDVRDVDLRNSYFQDTTGSTGGSTRCAFEILSFVDGMSGTWRYEDRDFPTGDVFPETIVELGEISTGLLSEPAEFADKGDALVTAVCTPKGKAASTWVLRVSRGSAIGVLRVGDEGVTGVESHRIVNGMAEIVVQTKQGQRTWRYSSNGYTLTRVS